MCKVRLEASDAEKKQKFDESKRDTIKTKFIMTPNPTRSTGSDSSLNSANVTSSSGSSCSDDESSRASTPITDCEIPNEMLKEIKVATEFLTQLVKQRFGDEAALRFEGQLQPRMVAFYNGHWFPKTPYRGMAYRCMRFNVWEIDPLVLAAATASGLTTKDLRSIFPAEFALWVDPGEVSYRIGEEGSVCELYTIADGCRQKPAAAASMIRGSGSFASPSPRKPMRPSAGTGTGEATSGYQITNNANPRHQQHQQHQMSNHQAHQQQPQRLSFGGGGPNVRRSFNPSFHQPQPQSPPRLGNHPPPPPPPTSNAYYYQQQQHHHHQRAQFNFRSSPDYGQMEKHRAGISSWLPGACKENLERLLDMNWPEISAAASS